MSNTRWWDPGREISSPVARIQAVNASNMRGTKVIEDPLPLAERTVLDVKYQTLQIRT
jgi:hypothetical protein